MPDLRRELEWLAAEFPATPDLRATVVDRIAADAPASAASRPPRRRASGRPPRLGGLPRPLRVALIAALVLLLAAGTVLAASRAAREFFGLRGATVERTATPPPALDRHVLALGRRVSVAEARRAAPFPLLVPAALGEPDAAHVLGEEVSLAYEPRPGLPEARQLGLGLLVTEVPGTTVVIGKLAPPTTRVQPVRVGPYRGIWIEGAPHFFGYRDSDGRFREGTLRAAGNVLLLERGDVLVRLEGELTRDRAIAIARSLR
jgi:hypothetical protein